MRGAGIFGSPAATGAPGAVTGGQSLVKTSFEVRADQDY
jgi:hypothetical protein